MEKGHLDMADGVLGGCPDSEQAWGGKARLKEGLGKSDWMNSIFSAKPPKDHAQEVRSSHGRPGEGQEALEWPLERLKT